LLAHLFVTYLIVDELAQMAKELGIVGWNKNHPNVQPPVSALPRPRVARGLN
jgi:hypothetical protein